MCIGVLVYDFNDRDVRNDLKLLIGLYVSQHLNFGSLNVQTGDRCVFVAVLMSNEPMPLRVHRFRSKDGSYVTLSTTASVFVNPWTKEREQIVCTHRRIQ